LCSDNGNAKQSAFNLYAFVGHAEEWSSDCSKFVTNSQLYAFSLFRKATMHYITSELKKGASQLKVGHELQAAEKMLWLLLSSKSAGQILILFLNIKHTFLCSIHHNNSYIVCLKCYCDLNAKMLLE
jgi:hypothetical protein